MAAERETIVVTSASCGPEHTVVLDDAGRTYVSGRGSYGRLGLNDEMDRRCLNVIDSTLCVYNLEGKDETGGDVDNQVVDWPAKGSRVGAICAGGLGSAFLDDAGRLYVCGWGGYGRLGLGETTLQETETESKSLARSLSPARILFVLSSPQSKWRALNTLSRKVLEDYYCLGFGGVAMGRYHTVVVDDEGYAYSCGLGNRGQLGQTDRENCCVARRVHGVAGIVAIACGDAHTILVDKSGQVYGCGRNNEGQIGVRRTTAAVAAAAAAAAATAAGGGGGGAGGSGPPGVGPGVLIDTDDDDGKSNDILEPVRLESIANKWVKQVACGAQHTLLLDATGQAWACGKGDFGQLGQGSTVNHDLPVRVEMPAGIQVRSVAAGDHHSVFVGSDGGAYCCGNGEHHQLGQGDPATDLIEQLSHALAVSTTAATPAAAEPASEKKGKTAGRTSVRETGGGGVSGTGASGGGSGGRGDGNDEDDLLVGSVSARDTDRHRPVRMRVPEGVHIVGAAAGRCHTVLWDDTGMLWVCGTGEHGELCCGDISVLECPTPVPYTGKEPHIPAGWGGSGSGGARRAKRSSSSPPTAPAAASTDPRYYAHGATRRPNRRSRGASAVSQGVGGGDKAGGLFDDDVSDYNDRGGSGLSTVVGDGGKGGGKDGKGDDGVGTQRREDAATAIFGAGGVPRANPLRSVNPSEHLFVDEDDIDAVSTAVPSQAPAARRSPVRVRAAGGLAAEGEKAGRGGIVSVKAQDVPQNAQQDLLLPLQDSDNGGSSGTGGFGRGGEGEGGGEDDEDDGARILVLPDGSLVQAFTAGEDVVEPGDDEEDIDGSNDERDIEPEQLPPSDPLGVPM